MSRFFSTKYNMEPCSSLRGFLCLLLQAWTVEWSKSPHLTAPPAEWWVLLQLAGQVGWWYWSWNVTGAWSRTGKNKQEHPVFWLLSACCCMLPCECNAGSDFQRQITDMWLESTLLNIIICVKGCISTLPNIKIILFFFCYAVIMHYYSNICFQRCSLIFFRKIKNIRQQGWIRCPFMLHVFNSYGDFANPNPLLYKSHKNAHKFQGHNSHLWKMSTFQKQAPSKGSFSTLRVVFFHIWLYCVFTQ